MAITRSIKNYGYILQSLKEKIRQARLRSSYTVNAQLLQLYWEIGNTILQQQLKEGWGTKVIDRLGADLKSAFPDMAGLSVRNIKYMRAFAEAYPDFIMMQQPTASLPPAKNKKGVIVQVPLAQLKKGIIKQPAAVKFQAPAIVQAPLAQLSWFHHITLLDKIKDSAIRLFYINKAVENGWSRNVMVWQIESQLHKRQGKALTNFDKTLPKPESDLAREILKSPYLFDFLQLGEEAKERELETALMQHLKKFLLELGRGFAYIGNQFNIDVGGDDFFFDLLFYNTRLHCYVVFELKIGEFEPEFAGKLNFYLNAVDIQIKMPEDKPTIGVLLCKTPNKTVIEYALRGIDKPLGVADFELNKALPKKLKPGMPTIQELEAALESEAKKFKQLPHKKIKKVTAKPKIKFGAVKKKKEVRKKKK